MSEVLAPRPSVAFWLCSCVLLGSPGSAVSLLLGPALEQGLLSRFPCLNPCLPFPAPEPIDLPRVGFQISSALSHTVPSGVGSSTYLDFCLPESLTIICSHIPWLHVLSLYDYYDYDYNVILIF